MKAEISVTNSADFAQPEVNGVAFAVGFFFSFRLCIVLLSVHLLGVGPSTGTALSIGLDLLLLGLVCFDSQIEDSGRIGAILRLTPVRWVVLFLAFSGLSLAWSETASFANSFVYWLGLAIDVANVMLLSRRSSGVEAAHWVLRGFIWSTCCLAAIAWMMPVAPDLRLGDEQFFNTNEIGNACALAIFFAQYLTRCRVGSWKFAKLFLVLTLIRSLSKTTLAAFLVSQGLMLLLDRSMGRKAKLLLAGSALLVLIGFWGLFEAYYNVYTTTGNQAETLTGRIVIWLYVLGATWDHPWTLWIGHGFDAWWKVVPPFGGELFEARHAENELLQQFYAYGVTGVVLIGSLYGSLYRRLRRIQRSPARTVFGCFLLFIVVRGVAESDAFDLLLPLWAIVLISVLAESARTSGEGISASGFDREGQVEVS